MGGFIAGGGHGPAGNGGPGIPVVSGQIRIYGVAGQACGMSRRNRSYGCLDCSCRSGPRKAQRRKYPEGRVACGNRAFGRPRRIPGGALHIRDQLHLVSGKFGEGQADHYILPAVQCPVIHARGDLDDRDIEVAEPADRDARPNAPRTGGRTGDTGTRPGMMRRNLYKAFVLAAGRSAGGFLHSSPFFLSVWRRSWRTGRNTRHHWAPACRTGRTTRRHAAWHIVPAPCHAVPNGTVRTPCRLQRVDVCRSACTCKRPSDKVRSGAGFAFPHLGHIPRARRSAVMRS